MYFALSLIAPARDQDVCSLLQSKLSCEEEKSIERVHQWIAQQQKFAGIPPPDEEQTLFRSQSNTEVTSKDVSSFSDSTSYKDWIPIYKSDDDILKFSGLEVNRYYSPNMTRRRGYVHCFDSSLNSQQIGSDITRSNANQLLATQDREDYREKRIDASPKESPVTCSPLSKYFCRSGEGNTFPRRNKLSNKDDRRNLFSSAIMDKASNLSNVTSEQKDVGISNRGNDDVTSNQYNDGVLSTSNDQQVDDRVMFLSYNRPFAPQDRDINTDKNNNLLSNMSLDTQRLLSGNLPDVALTAAKAIHKRELSDSLPKYKIRTSKDLYPSHVRVSSAPETTFVISGADQKKSDYNTNETVQKVKAFSWPKRAVLPSYKDFMKGGHVKKNTRMKTESGYNTEKSEEKNDVVPNDGDEFTETVDRIIDTDHSPGSRGVNSCHSDSPRSSCADSSHGNESSNSMRSSCTESRNSGQSDSPPARPPLPSQTTLLLKDAHAYTSSKSIELSKKDVTLSDASNVSTHSLYSKSRPIERLSTMGSLPLKTADNYYHSMRYLKSKECAVTPRLSSFCPPSAELTRNVSMSLKDLIRIHEQEIARVSGGGSTNRLKTVDPMQENRRKGSFSELRGRSKCAWKRHTTIGLLTHYDVDRIHDNTIDYSPENLQLQTCPDSKGSTCSEKSSVILCRSVQPEVTSPPFSSEYLSGKYDRKKNAPHVLPKPSKSLLSPLTVDISERPVTDETYEVHKTEEKGTQAHVIMTRPLYKDASMQTDLVLVDLYASDVKETGLGGDKTELEMKFEKEKQVLHRKLEEQKKVANAYQKLEDRYRRKVYELQKALHLCTCSKDNVPVKLYTGDNSNPSYSNLPVVSGPDKHDISVQKVDGILHQLEAWLNKQTNGLHTDKSALSSLIESTTTTTSKDTSYSRNFKSLPLDIIDQIDATSV